MENTDFISTKLTFFAMLTDIRKGKQRHKDLMCTQWYFEQLTIWVEIPLESFSKGIKQM